MAAHPERIGKYEVRAVLGKGAMGIVYEAWDPDIERTVAIKTVRTDAIDAELAQQFMARFRNEAKAAGRLHHPNIVGVHEFGEQGPLAYIAMEFVRGAGLRDYLQAKSDFDFAELVALMSQLLDALEFAHARGVVHRDVKPANLIVTPEAVLKVADFGVARIDRSNLTTAGMLIGTPSYMSPEQCMGREVDARSDLFSAGVVLYELVAGEKPFTGALEAITFKICHEDPPPPSRRSGRALPPALDRLVATALAKDPGQRFATARAFKDALQEVARMPVETVQGEGTTLVALAEVRLQAPGSSIDEATLSTAERELARLVGPVARVLVRQAAMQSHDRGELCALLAENIQDPEQRERFRKSLAGGVAGASASRSAGPAASMRSTAPHVSAATRGAPAKALDAEFIAYVTARLAIHVGPIARIIAKQASGAAYDRDDFVRLCADHIGTKERGEFLRSIGTHRLS